MLNSGEYGGWNNKRTPQFASKAVRIGSTKWPWWKPQLSTITASLLSSTADAPVLVRLTASSKNNRSSWPLDGPSSTFIKSTPNGECSRLIVYVALEAYRWISNAGSPLGAFPYFRLLVVFTILLSSNSERCLVLSRILLRGIHFDDGYCHSFVILMVFAVFSFLSCRDPP